MKKAAFVALCVGLLVPSAAMAAVLDFSTGTGGAGGTVVNVGGGDALGFDIRIDTLVVSGAGAFDGVYNVDGAVACATGGGASCGALSFDTSTGTLSIVGSVPALGVPLTTLLSGTIDSFMFFPSTTSAAMFASGADTKVPILLTSLGLNPSSPYSFIGSSLSFGPAVVCDGRLVLHGDQHRLPQHRSPRSPSLERCSCWAAACSAWPAAPASETGSVGPRTRDKRPAGLVSEERGRRPRRAPAPSLASGIRPGTPGAPT